MELTRKTQEDGKYLLLTTTDNKYNAQLEVDILLIKYFKNTNLARCSPTRRNAPIVNNHFSTYTEALAKSPSPTPDNYLMLIFPPFTIQRPYTILFSSNIKDNITPSPLQKRKVISYSNSSITNTTSEPTMDPVTLDITSTTEFKEEVKELLVEIKAKIMT